MHLVVIHDWKKDSFEVAKTIASTMDTLVFEAQQKIAGGGPAVLTSFADPVQAESLAVRLTEGDVPTFVVDPEDVRDKNRLFYVQDFVFEEQALRLESAEGESCVIDYGTIELLLTAIYSVGQTLSGETATRRKFSLGKTLLAGGVPRTKKVKDEEPVIVDERDETLWLYAHGQPVIIFDRAELDFEGFGDAIRLTRDLNFSFLKSELRRLATAGRYDDRLLKRAGLVRLLGSTLSPKTDLDLAFEILSRSLREAAGSD